ncbi:FG-GAP-like repeat-containing protein [Streptomyces sp. bgisy153]|uniref:FG-GAP-like repeat-containing protein n=1 Tax=Streptomyces sp. bgisy153 TaxID=3413793 RepID=UPI003D763DE2
MTRHVPRRTAMATGLLAAALLTAGLPASAHAVTGPAVTDGGYAFTARLETGDGEDTLHACTGALVDPQWILTAASCFTGGSGELAPGAPAEKTVATVGRTDLTTTGGHVSEIVDLVPRPGRDLVLARLAQPATGITPVKVSTTPAAQGDTLTVPGYGRTRTEWAPTGLHTASFTVDAVTATEVDIHGTTTDDAICKGDAGAPLLRVTGGTPQLVGVGSRSWQGGCFGSDPAQTRNGAIAGRVDDIGAMPASRLTAGQRLSSGDSLIAGRVRLTMRTDGDLAVVSPAGRTLWSAGTAGHPGATAALDTTGNLVVRDAAGTTVLWQSATAATGGTATLRPGGDLVVRDAQGVSKWSSNSAPRHDYNGDGRSDMADWYDYADGSDKIHAFLATDNGGFDSPVHGWYTAPGNYWAENMKRLTGDFNGDGIADVAAFYGYANGDVALLTWLGNGDGTFQNPLHSWKVTSGWTFSRMTANAGDFNGDGRDDIAVWYDYADGSDKLHTFLANAVGGFSAPFSSFQRTDGWTASNMKFTTGDFNGDGRDDLGTLYGYASGEVKLITFLAKADGGFNEPVHGWNSTGWNFDRASIHSGDFDGDGHDDIVSWYDYGDGHDAVIRFTLDGNGAFGDRTEIWSTPAGNYTRSGMKIVTGDYDGDGRDDLATVYGYADGRVKTITWTSKADGTLNSPLHSWEAPAGSWTFNSMHMIERYNSPS